MANLRRRAERHRLDLRTMRDQRIEPGEVRDALDAGRVGVDRGGQREPIVGPQRWEVLVAGNLAETDHRDADRPARGWGHAGANLVSDYTDII